MGKLLGAVRWLWVVGAVAAAGGGWLAGRAWRRSPAAHAVACAGAGGSSAAATVEACRVSCLSRDEHCLLAGDQQADRGRQSVARDLYLRGCERGVPSACVRAARLTEDARAARAMLGKACAGGALEGCTRLGEMLERNAPATSAAAATGTASATGGAADAGSAASDGAVAAQALFRRACPPSGEADGLACFHVGIALERVVLAKEQALEAAAGLSEAQVEERDAAIDVVRDQALAAHRRGCELGSAEACYAAAVVGHGTVPRDEQLEQRWLAAACERGELRGCAELAWRLRSSRLLEREDRRAALLLARACDGGFGRACRALAELVLADEGMARDLGLVARLEARACELGPAGTAALHLPMRRSWQERYPSAEDAYEGGRSCEDAADRLRHGDGVAADPEGALALYRLACERSAQASGWHPGCRPLAEMATEDEGIDTPAERIRLLALACRVDGPGCEVLAELAGHGEGIETAQDEVRLLALSCDRASFGCLELGRLVERGEGTAADPARADRLFRRHCGGDYRRRGGEIECLLSGFGSGHGRLGGSRRARPPRVRMGTTCVSGRLDPKLVGLLLRQQSGRLEACYRAELPSNPRARGKVTLAFGIGRDGKVSNVSAADSDLSASATSCLTRTLSEFVFPPAQGGILTLSHSFDFEPRGAR